MLRLRRGRLRGLRLPYSYRPRSTEAEEGQDGHDHNDQADEINDAVHVLDAFVTRFGDSQKARTANWLPEDMQIVRREPTALRLVIFNRP